MGSAITLDQASTQCDPAVTNAQMGKQFSYNGQNLTQSEVAYPCGLIAKSLFTDTYEFS